MRKKTNENSLFSAIFSAVAIRTAKHIIYKATNSDPNTKLLTVPMELMFSEFVTDKSLKQSLQAGSLLNASIDLMQLGMEDTPIYAESRKDKKTIRDILRNISFNFDPILDVAYFMDGTIHLSKIEKPIFFLRGQILFILNGTEDFIRWISVTGTKNKKFQSLEELIVENRTSYFKYIHYKAGADLGGPQNQNDVTINKSGTGKNNYIAFPQGESDNADGGLLECYGTTLVYTMMHLGYVDGSLSNKELTEKFLSRHSNEKKNVLKFSELAIHDFRGLSKGVLNYFGTKDTKTGKLTYHLDRIEREIQKFQHSDFSKLMGNDTLEIKLIPLQTKTLIENVDRVNSGYPVQFVGNPRMFFDTRHYVLPYRMRTIKQGAKYDMYYIDPIRKIEEVDETTEYYDNGKPVDSMSARKKRRYDITESYLRGTFTWMVVPKSK